MICCGFGHRELYINLEPFLTEHLEKLIQNDEDLIFYSGGMGATDSAFVSAIAKLRAKNHKVKLMLVIPYLTNELNEYKDYYENLYDDIIMPEELLGVHYKSAIEKRNRWMIDNSDIIFDATYREFGGAYKAIKYAIKQSKRVINLTKK